MSPSSKKVEGDKINPSNHLLSNPAHFEGTPAAGARWRDPFLAVRALVLTSFRQRIDKMSRSWTRLICAAEKASGSYV